MENIEPENIHRLTTEQPSFYDDLEKMSTLDLLVNINKEDQTVPFAVEKAIPQLEKLVNAIVEKMEKGGRLFYIGAGTSGRLGIVDASECPPTYGVPQDLVIGIIAGGDKAIRQSIEFAEDDDTQAFKDLQRFHLHANDFVIGIAASGRTPYVIGGVHEARQIGAGTGCITCNSHTKLATTVEHPVEIIVGPEFVTGSTRMKSGTAQKLALNMISTAVMIRLGRVRGNKMVDMQLTNTKLVRRAVNMVMAELDVDAEQALELLEKYGSVRGAIDSDRVR